MEDNKRQPCASCPVVVCFECAGTTKSMTNWRCDRCREMAQRGFKGCRVNSYDEGGKFKKLICNASATACGGGGYLLLCSHPGCEKALHPVCAGYVHRLPKCRQWFCADHLKTPQLTSKNGRKTKIEPRTCWECETVIPQASRLDKCRLQPCDSCCAVFCFECAGTAEFKDDYTCCWCKKAEAWGKGNKLTVVNTDTTEDESSKGLLCGDFMGSGKGEYCCMTGGVLVQCAVESCTNSQHLCCLAEGKKGPFSWEASGGARWRCPHHAGRGCMQMGREQAKQKQKQKQQGLQKKKQNTPTVKSLCLKGKPPAGSKAVTSVRKSPRLALEQEEEEEEEEQEQEEEEDEEEDGESWKTREERKEKHHLLVEEAKARRARFFNSMKRMDRIPLEWAYEDDDRAERKQNRAERSMTAEEFEEETRNAKINRWMTPQIVDGKVVPVNGDGVCLKLSTLSHSAGLGLFADQDFKEDDPITEFCGWEVSRNTAKRLEKEGRASHCITVRAPCVFVLDCKDIDFLGVGIAQYANDGTWPVGNKDPPGENAVEVLVDCKLTGKTRLFLKAKRFIKKGEEIFFKYAEKYWSGSRGV
uniref:SET domain-containing protein n=1 Tax=Chromera velia CCMP2878 TaxID=1169474 RepID=A0A0G4IFP2_9ALVE|eukprot:Cvel_13984.t1-p1 / transcript=Cvel_13984.t1 / gene=Cvel_13984 / organism=Chromera_velia_CCMP2878 / gene_product=hypothetical protein / transcript_product=hypothetical protein / location=Cvel_scaffold977:43117-51752(+) / protein_length=585 / sequence_SO=supercontig / SO=protein_coding / is_pseudo=false